MFKHKLLVIKNYKMPWNTFDKRPRRKSIFAFSLFNKIGNCSRLGSIRYCSGHGIIYLSIVDMRNSVYLNIFVNNIIQNNIEKNITFLLYSIKNIIFYRIYKN